MHRPQDEVVPLHEPFETALRGFNRQQVLAHIESLDGRITMVVKDRESALAQVAELSRTIGQLREESELLAHLRQEREKANEQVKLMVQAPIVGASTRIQQIVRLAEEEAAELKARAEQEAAAHRKRILEEAEQEITRKEAEAADRIRLREQRSLAGLHLLLKIVGPQLAERVSVVERMEAELAESHTRIGREMTALEAFRAKVTAQLSVTRQLVAEVLEQVQQNKIESPGPTRHPVPLQREGHPAGQREVESAPGQLVNNSRADKRR